MSLAGNEPVGAWTPSWAFFREGQLLASERTNESPVSWKLLRHDGAGMGFCHISCEMNWGSLSCVGEGYDFRAKAAATKAFAESWERLWVFKTKSPSSNGFAAGATADAAKNAALEELIERSIFLNCWHSERGWAQTRLSGASARLLAARLNSKGWTLRVFELADARLGSVLAGVASHPQNGLTFDSSYLGWSRDRRSIEVKILRSITRSVLHRKGAQTDSDLPLDGSPEDHAMFYADPERARCALRFLDDPSATSPPPTLACPESVSIRVVYEGGDMPAVAIAKHEDWPVLCWGSQAIQGQNKWPHPLV